VRHSYARSRRPSVRNAIPQHHSRSLAFKMFVPRAVRLKGVKEPPRPRLSKPSPEPISKDDTDSRDGLVEAMGDASMDSPAPQQDVASDAPAPSRGPRFTTKPVTPEYVSQLAAGIELIFTDYAHQEEERSRWLKNRYRVIDGDENCGIYMTCTCAVWVLMRHRYTSHRDPRTPLHLEAEARSHPDSPQTSPARPSVRYPRAIA
jgi:hypothetical protein